jgi:hypothetical protein
MTSRAASLPRTSARVTPRSRSVERHERALADVFGAVPALRADAGLATVGVIAVDGTKVHADASRDRSMAHEDIARAVVEEVVATDAAETVALPRARISRAGSLANSWAACC